MGELRWLPEEEPWGQTESWGWGGGEGQKAKTGRIGLKGSCGSSPGVMGHVAQDNKFVLGPTAADSCFLGSTRSFYKVLKTCSLTFYMKIVVFLKSYDWEYIYKCNNACLEINNLCTYYNLCKHSQGITQSADGAWCVDRLQWPWPGPATVVSPSTLMFSDTQTWEVGTIPISFTGVLSKAIIIFSNKRNLKLSFNPWFSFKNSYAFDSPQKLLYCTA